MKNKKRNSSLDQKEKDKSIYKLNQNKDNTHKVNNSLKKKPLLKADKS